MLKIGPTIGSIKTYSIKEAMDIYLLFPRLVFFFCLQITWLLCLFTDEFLPHAAWMTLDTDEDIWKFWTNSWQPTFQIMHMAQKQSGHIF